MLNDIWLYGIFVISINQMPFPAQNLDTADPLFTLVIIQGFYLHHVEVANQDPASISL